MSKAKKTALGAVLCAFTLVLLYLGSIFQVMSLSLVAIAGLLPTVLIIESGLGSGALMYVASSILAILLVPDKQVAILYIVLFGSYPFIKYGAERVKPIILTWLIKIVASNALVVAIYFVFRAVFIAFVPEGVVIWLVFLAFNAIFILYDICFSKLVGFYMVRVHKHIV